MKKGYDKSQETHKHSTHRRSSSDGSTSSISASELIAIRNGQKPSVKPQVVALDTSNKEYKTACSGQEANVLSSIVCKANSPISKGQVVSWSSGLPPLANPIGNSYNLGGILEMGDDFTRNSEALGSITWEGQMIVLIKTNTDINYTTSPGTPIVKVDPKYQTLFLVAFDMSVWGGSDISPVSPIVKWVYPVAAFKGEQTNVYFNPYKDGSRAISVAFVAMGQAGYFSGLSQYTSLVASGDAFAQSNKLGVDGKRNLYNLTVTPSIQPPLQGSGQSNTPVTPPTAQWSTSGEVSATWESTLSYQLVWGYERNLGFGGALHLIPPLPTPSTSTVSSSQGGQTSAQTGGNFIPLPNNSVIIGGQNGFYSLPRLFLMESHPKTILIGTATTTFDDSLTYGAYYSSSRSFYVFIANKAGINVSAPRGQFVILSTPLNTSIIAACELPSSIASSRNAFYILVEDRSTPSTTPSSTQLEVKPPLWLGEINVDTTINLLTLLDLSSYYSHPSFDDNTSSSILPLSSSSSSKSGKYCVPTAPLSNTVTLPTPPTGPTVSKIRAAEMMGYGNSLAISWTLNVQQQSNLMSIPLQQILVVDVQEGPFLQLGAPLAWVTLSYTFRTNYDLRTDLMFQSDRTILIPATFSGSFEIYISPNHPIRAYRKGNGVNPHACIINISELNYPTIGVAMANASIGQIVKVAVDGVVPIDLSVNDMEDDMLTVDTTPTDTSKAASKLVPGTFYYLNSKGEITLRTTDTYLGLAINEELIRLP